MRTGYQTHSEISIGNGAAEKSFMVVRRRTPVAGVANREHQALAQEFRLVSSQSEANCFKPGLRARKLSKRETS